MPVFDGFPRGAIEQSIPARFAQQAAQHSQRLAVRTRRCTWTYAQLDAFAAGVARAIHRAAGSGPGVVAVLCAQDAPLVGAILGVLCSGKTYLPIEAVWPAARLAWMLDDAGAELIVADARHASLATTLAADRRRVLVIAEAPPAAPSACGQPVVAAAALAYIYYTSGSTGVPKGVVDTHRNVLHNVMRYTTRLRITPEDRLTLLQTAGFSGAVSSMFGALLNGAAVFPFDLREEGPARLAAWLREERITIYHSVPAIFRSFLAENAQFPDVRVIRLEGDAAAASDVALFGRHFAPTCILANGLGATETGLSCQYLMGQDDVFEGGIVPIGFPAPDMDVMLLDVDGRVLVDGEVGEIVVRSEFLSPGYWRRPELTAAAFRTDPNDPKKRLHRTGDLGRRRGDGCIEYLGRKDFQLKVLGHRVEPAEVEAALLAFDNIKEATVTTQPDGRGGARLSAWLVAWHEPVPSVESLRHALAARLPDFMVPGTFVFLDALPLNENGKVDRRALATRNARPDERSRAIVAPRDAIERELVALWEEILHTRPLGVGDDFIDAGGDSLAATRLLAAIEQKFGRRLPRSTLVEATTVEQLACVIRSRAPAANASTLVPLQPRGAAAPFFCVHDLNGEVFLFARLARLLGEERPFHGLRAVGLVDGEQPLASIETMAARHLASIRAVQARGPYFLGGFCFGAVVAGEMARQLRAQGETVALVAYLSITPFDFRRLLPACAWLRYRRYRQQATFFELLRLRLGEALARSGRAAVWQLVQQARSAVSRLARPPKRTDAEGVPAANDGVVAAAHRAAFARYRPQTLSVPVVVFLDEGVRDACTPDALADHRGLTTDRLAVHITPGAEHAMLREPAVQELARQLAQVLRDA